MGPIAAYLLEFFLDGNVPERLHCDNGNEFVNQCVKEVNRLLNMSSYSQGKTRHPQTQGLIERANGTVKMKILKKCCDLGYTTPGRARRSTGLASYWRTLSVWRTTCGQQILRCK